jgi:hypothetical protein
LKILVTAMVFLVNTIPNEKWLDTIRIFF